MHNMIPILDSSRPSHGGIWTYRKAAWAIEDMEQDIALVYRQMGQKGLASIPDVGAGLAGEVARLIEQRQELTLL